ncbi:MAG: restriction endonuclease subunit S [Treponema sp.]|jgi:restriction endonuclease S subunit|nr:restriction endonuclease subunit S [Treponema sp.]
MNNISSWDKFKLSDLFYYMRGKGITTTEISENAGNIPCVQSGEAHNGIIGYMDGSFEKDKKHTYVAAPFLSVARSGTSGCVNVQAKDSYIGDSVYALKLKTNESIYIYLFITSILNKERYRYSYGHKVSIETYINQFIKLPADNESQPDWAYIENFAKKIYDKITPKITTNIKRKIFSFDMIGKWGNFKMDDIFIFRKGRRITKENITQGRTNFIASIDDNNGIREKIDVPPAHKGNCITVNYNGSVGEAFYQIEPFCASDDVNVLYLKDWKLNKYIGIFLVTIIRFNKYRFGYGRKWTLEKMKETHIALPIIKNNTPDWQFMENYIRSLPYSDKI